MSLKYQGGQEIMLGDWVFFHGEAAEIELVAEPSSNHPEHGWYVQEFGGGVTVWEPEAKTLWSCFHSADQLPENEDLEFVARRDSPYVGLEGATGLRELTNEGVKRRVHDSSELSKRGKSDDALELLALSIHTALKADKINWVQILCRHASAVADSVGNLASVRRYRGLAVQHAPDDPLDLFGLADILSRQGEHEFARMAAAKSYDIAAHSGDQLDRSLTALLVKRWPELKSRDNRQRE